MGRVDLGPEKSAVQQPLPLTLGSDLSGEIVVVGPGVSDLCMGGQVNGVTNPRFVGAYAEYALASAAMVSRRPTSLTYIEAASVPVIAVTAWQALFDQAHLKAGQWSFTGRQGTSELMRFSWPVARACEPSRLQARFCSWRGLPRRGCSSSSRCQSIEVESYRPSILATTKMSIAPPRPPPKSRYNKE
jgi:hypothetical protein